MRLPRPTVRARLTLLYTALFALCGAIIVAVSYTLVAQLRASGQGNGRQPSSVGAPASVVALCRSAKLHRDQPSLATCNAALQQLGAQHQRALTLSHLLEYSLVTLAVVIALAAFLGWVFSGRALRPVKQVTAAARAASEHNLSARVALRGPRDELHELAETFDEMLGRLQAAFEGQQRFIANASHELRTPLAVMRTTVDVVAGNAGSTPEDLRAMAAEVRSAVDHAEGLIGALLILAATSAGSPSTRRSTWPPSPRTFLDTSALGDRSVHVTLGPAVISGDPVLAERLVANLVDNAARYNDADGDIWVGTRTAAGASQLTVANTGPVVTPADAERIFQPFQRLNERTSGDGFGLGLAIVASIAAVHGGTVSARPRDGGGLSVMVTIPSASSPAQGTAGRKPSDHVPHSQADICPYGDLRLSGSPDVGRGRPVAFGEEAMLGHLFSART
jgi:signal transduction histidine kinase